MVNTIEMRDLEQIRQELDLWIGTLHNEFDIGAPDCVVAVPVGSFQKISP